LGDEKTKSNESYKMYWMLSQKAQNADLGTDHQEMLTRKAQAAEDKSMHLLVIKLNLERYSLELTVTNVVTKSRIRAAMQSKVQTEELRKIRNKPPLPQAHGGEPKEDSDREGGKPTNDCAGISNKSG
jgi:hypothetical protein